MASIFESIEILSKEKGIDPQIVINAVKDAMLVAARKQFRTNEDLAAEMDPKTDKIHIFVVKRVVDEVQDPLNELTLGEAMVMDPAPKWARKSASQRARNHSAAFRRRQQSKSSCRRCVRRSGRRSTRNTRIVSANS